MFIGRCWFEWKYYYKSNKPVKHLPILVGYDGARELGRSPGL